MRIRQLPSRGDEGTAEQQAFHARVGEARRAYRDAEKVLRLLKKAKAAPAHLAEETAKVDRLRADYYAAEDELTTAIREGRA